MANRSEIVTQLEELLEKEFSEELLPIAKELRTKYQSALVMEHKEFIAQAEESEDSESTQPQRDATDEKFDALWASYSKRQRDWKKDIADSQATNLKARKKIIADIKRITQEEEHIKTAFESIKALEEAWDQTGAVAPDDYREIQHEYNRARDDFFYNIRIYKELLEHDLKRNLQLKEAVIEKLKSLRTLKSIKDIENQLRGLNKEWDQIGPTYQEEWERVRDAYRDIQKTLYEKVNSHYVSLREQQQANLEKKESLCKRLEQINENEIHTEKRWRKLTDQVIQMQKDWKTIGFVPKDQNEQIWERFKHQGDIFFDRKGEFYKGLKIVQDTNKEKKLKLIEEAEQFKESEDWKGATIGLKKLQNRWQGIGKTHQRDEQRLWRQFRATCNYFFERKKAFFYTKDDREAENLNAKQAVIKELETLKVTDKEPTLKAIEELTTKFNAVGFVPIEAKQEIQTQFDTLIAAKYNELGLKPAKIKELQFKTKVNEIKHSKNSDRVAAIEERKVRERIRKLEATVTQYENNLGFFGNSKGAEALKKQVEEKITANQQELETLKEKLKVIQRIGSNS